MPETITALPDAGNTPADSTVLPADGGWAQTVDVATGHIATAVLAAVIGGLTVWLITRRRTGRDFSKHLMYVPLLLVNAAAIYGQVAFFYDNVAPSAWPVIGKLALASVIAAAIESIAVYVGWHAHDALLNKAGNTAARLRRASYVIAALVAGINYAHFANPADDNRLGLTAASLAFGLLSLLSPWLWGLHTRRMQHVQLRKEGVVDATGATFSGERVRSFPFRAYAARRWSIDNYVTDPKQAWEGYNAELRQRWARSVDTPGWWMRVNPVARVRQLTAGLTEQRTINAGQASRITDLETRLAEATSALDQNRAELASAAHLLEAADASVATLSAEREEHLRELEDLRSEVSSTTTRLTAAEGTLGDLQSKLDTATERLSEATSDLKERTSEVASLTTKVGGLEERLRDTAKEHTDALRKAKAEAKIPNISGGRRATTGRANLKPSNRARLTDEEAVQRLLEAPPDPVRNLPSGDVREWSQQAIVDTLPVGWSRAPRLLEAVTEAQRNLTAEDASEDRAVNQ